MADPKEVRRKVRGIIEKHLRTGDPYWFDDVYSTEELAEIPWADHGPNPSLVSWLEGPHAPSPPKEARSKRALVVGCGLGDDAEALASRGWDVVAFDVAPHAVEWCVRRFPSTSVTYEVADLLALPPSYHRAFHLVYEAYTLQSLPHTMRAAAIAAIADCVAPGGALLVLTQGRDEGPMEAVPGPPWAIAPSELSGFTANGLEEVSFEAKVDYEAATDAQRNAMGKRLSRATYARRASG